MIGRTSQLPNCLQADFNAQQFVLPGCSPLRYLLMCTCCATRCVQNQDVVQLQIGYHVLEGKRMPLKKPMAIMDKVQELDSEGNDITVCKVSGRRVHAWLYLCC
jgi:hypothetical protein